MPIPSLDEFLALPAGRRRNYRFSSKPRGRYEKRPPRSREELSQYLRDRNVLSSRDLLKKRQAGEPRPEDYVKMFGSWAKGMQAAFPNELPFVPPPNDPHYIIKAVILFNLWTYEKYAVARKRRPDIIPSLRQVVQIFGGYSNLKQFAERESLKRTLQKYIELREELRKWPTIRDCREAGLDISRALRHFHSKRAMVDFVKTLAGCGKRMLA